MPRKTIALAGAALLAACASQPPPPPIAEPEPPPPPVVFAEPVVTEPVVEAIPPVPEAPPRPQQTDAGRFRVGVASLESAELAARWVGKVEAAGYRSEVLPVQIEGKTWHRVLAPGYANLAEAQAAIPFIEQDLGIQGAWVTSRRRAPTPDAVTATAPAEGQPAN